MKLNAYAADAVAAVPSSSGATSEGNPTDGDTALGLLATAPGARWFYQVQEEMHNLVRAAGLQPDIDTLTQLRDAVRGLASFPQGTKMVFHQAAAPAGWTKDIAVHDRLLRVVDTVGGGTGGSWEISGLTVEETQISVDQLPAHSHGAGSLAADQAGQHQHTIDYSTGSDSQGDAARFIRTETGTRETGEAGEHGHTVSGTTAESGGGGGHAHNIAADGNWRPAYANVIVCSKD